MVMAELREDFQGEEDDDHPEEQDYEEDQLEEDDEDDNDDDDYLPEAEDRGWDDNNHWNKRVVACASGLVSFVESFEEAKREASIRDRWLIINLQSQGEFNSWLLDQNTWRNKAVSDLISENFVFWQSDEDCEEGKKVLAYYKLSSLPSVVLVDPITGERMWSKSGFIPPETLGEKLSPFMGTTPEQRNQISPHAATVRYPPLPRQEPKQGCRVAVRLPSGRRRARNFLETDPVQLLWSFSSSLLDEEARTAGRDFELLIAVPGEVQYLDYERKLTLGESGWSNSVVSLKLTEG